MGDVVAVEHAVEVDVVNHAISMSGRLGDVTTHGGDAQNAATVGDDLAVNFLGTSLKDLAVRRGMFV